jgi:hypothetical protein
MARQHHHRLPWLTHRQGKRFIDPAFTTGRCLETLMLRGGKSGVAVDSAIAMLRSGIKKGCAEIFAEACEPPAVLLCPLERRSDHSDQSPREGSTEALQ